MSTKVIARVLLTLGFLAASIGYSSWTAQRTVLDPTATRGATHALLATPVVNAMLTRELRTALVPALAQIDAAASAARPKPPGAKPLRPKTRAAKARAAHDAAVKLNAAIAAAVHDPKFAGAFEDAIMNLHQSLLSGGTGQVTLDSGAVTGALDRAIARIDPKAAPQAKQLQTVSVPLGATNLPHIGDIRHDARVVGNTAIAIAVLLIGGALLLTPNRKAFRRTGRRIAFLALPPALVFLALPHLMASHGGALAVSAVLLEAFGHRVLFSAALLAGIGAVVWLVAATAPARRAKEPTVRPAADAGEPPLPDPRTPSPDPVPAESAFRP